MSEEITQRLSLGKHHRASSMSFAVLVALPTFRLWRVGEVFCRAIEHIGSTIVHVSVLHFISKSLSHVLALTCLQSPEEHGAGVI